MTVKVADIVRQVKDPEQDTIDLAYIRGATNGAVSLAGQAVTFTPVENHNGKASLTLAVHDNKGNYVDVVLAINVKPVNSKPKATDSILTFGETVRAPPCHPPHLYCEMGGKSTLCACASAKPGRFSRRARSQSQENDPLLLFDCCRPETRWVCSRPPTSTATPSLTS